MTPVGHVAGGRGGGSDYKRFVEVLVGEGGGEGVDDIEHKTPPIKVIALSLSLLTICLHGVNIWSVFLKQPPGSFFTRYDGRSASK